MGAAVSSRGPGRPRRAAEVASAHLHVRLTPEAKAYLRRAAEEAGVSLSEYVLKAALTRGAYGLREATRDALRLLRVHPDE